jgi:predicted AAA+ superfamily ATPase
MVLEFGNHEVVRMRDQTLIYGTYPAVLNAKSPTDKKQELFDLSSSALYRDIVEFQDIRNPAVLTKLLKLVALQIGQEVSLNALAQEIGINNRTVERYIDLLEKSFVIYRLPPYFTNKRKEIIKMQKIYFFDLGIRNAILGQYGAIEDRTDK